MSGCDLSPIECEGLRAFALFCLVVGVPMVCFIVDQAWRELVDAWKVFRSSPE